MFLYAFDLIESNGDDLRRDPLEVRKATLASVLARARHGLRLNEHIEADGPTVFAHACRMGLEGIVSKRKNSAYASRDWLKSKNPDCAAVRREAEEDWSRRLAIGRWRRRYLRTRLYLKRVRANAHGLLSDRCTQASSHHDFTRQKPVDVLFEAGNI